MTLATVVVGAVGGIIRLLSVVEATPPWIGVSLVTLATILSASVVFGAGVFFAPEVAGKAFWTSLARGFGLFLLVGALLAVDTASRRLLALDIPLLTIIALVVTIAVYEPALSWSRSRLGGRSPSAMARERLLTALGRSTLHAQGADAGVQPALTRMTQALNLAGAVVVRPDGSIAATQGATPDPATGPAIALVADDELMGELRVGHTLSGAPLGAGDQELLRLSAAYVAAALRTGRREDEQAEALSGLSQDRAHVESSATDLYEALVRRSAGRPGLRVFALGPLRVRARRRVDRALGRREGRAPARPSRCSRSSSTGANGAWPRTRRSSSSGRTPTSNEPTSRSIARWAASATRSTRTARAPSARSASTTTAIGWTRRSWTGRTWRTFLARLDQARAAGERTENLRLLEEARALYRGEYLDDCPFYGDSALVEERRASLRGRSLDLLIALGEGYEATGDRASAAAAYREAVAVAVDGCPPAEAGLVRLAAS